MVFKDICPYRRWQRIPRLDFEQMKTNAIRNSQCLLHSTMGRGEAPKDGPTEPSAPAYSPLRNALIS